MVAVRPFPATLMDTGPRRSAPIIGAQPLAACFLVVCASATGAPPTQSVPLVGCPADGQMGPMKPPSADRREVTLSPAVAAQIAYYDGAAGPGVFAPRGWHCRQWYGSNGSFVIVTPMPPEDRFPASAIPGSGVMFSLRDAGTSGRFEVAEVSARFFPKVMQSFIQTVRDEKLVPDSDFDVVPFPTDVVKHVPDRLVMFTTPARLNGFGTGSFLPSDEPIRGLVALSPESEETVLLQFQMRLPAGKTVVASALMHLEE